MFSKYCFRLMWLSFAAAFAILMGGHLIRYVSSIVIAARLGDYLPLIVLIVCSVALLRISGKFDDKDGLLFNLISIIAWASVILLAIASALIILPFGIVPMIAAVALVGLLARLVQDPQSSISILGQLFGSYPLISFLVMKLYSVWEGHTFSWLRISTSSLALFIIPKEYEMKIIQLMRDRPMLPVSMTILDEFDALVLRAKHLEDWHATINNLLQRNKIPYEIGSQILLKLVLALPLIENEGELAHGRYCIIPEQKLIDVLLTEGANYVTLFPRIGGLIAVCPDVFVSGYNVSRLPTNVISSLLINRDTRMIPAGVRENGHST